MTGRTVPKPRARAAGVVVRELPDEVLVYDLDTHRAVCLNSTTAHVWRLCDGRRTPADIRKALERSSGGPVPEELVWLALEQLGRARLLDAHPPRPAELAGLTRREMIRRVGHAAAVALPVVASIVAPTPAQASSCLPSGAACTTSAQCCSEACGGGGQCA